MAKRVTTLGLVSALLTSALAMPGSAYAGSCADARAREALEVRVLQSELMVAALTCGERPSYNAFVTAFKPYLQNQGTVLRTFFTDQFGPSAGPNKLNKMITRLANEASQNSLSQGDYCDQARARFSAILQGSPKGVGKVAHANPTASSHGFQTCVEVAAGTSPVKSGQN